MSAPKVKAPAANLLDQLWAILLEHRKQVTADPHRALEADLEAFDELVEVIRKAREDA